MNEEVREHLDRSGEFLAAAENLEAAGFHAIAVGRGYYAMFHAATAALIQRGVRRGSHHAVISAFGEYLIKPGSLPVHLHKYLQDAFDARGDGDYGPSPSMSAEKTREQLGRAREFVRVCTEWCRRSSDSDTVPSGS